MAPVSGSGCLRSPARSAAAKTARAAWAALAVFAAALLAGLRRHPLPLTGAKIGDLGLTATDHPGTVVQALQTVLLDNRAILAVAVVFALSAALLPFARRRGRVWIAAVCLGQALLIVTVATTGVTELVLGSWLLCGLLVLRPAR